MNRQLTCELGAFMPYVPSSDVPWNRAAAQHVHRRLGYGLGPALINDVLAEDPVAHLRNGLRAAAMTPPLAQPPWAFSTLSDYADFNEAAEQIIGWRSVWIDDFRQNPWRSKMVLFWSNHFVTQIDVYNCPSWLWQYHDLLQRHAFGNFKTFVREIGRTPAMLVYLNGVQSTRFEPNENYARELFELFTLGESIGYTQSDITEAARALTGFNGFTEACAPIGFVSQLHDPGSKSIFGKTGPYNYDGLIDLLFEERPVEVSQHICRRLYRYFVSVDVDESIVAALATIFRNADWELLPVYEALFTSEHFLSPALYGSRIKDPLELFLGVETALETDVFKTVNFTLAIWFAAAETGQQLFEPPDVAGWPGGRTWINANLLSLRNQGTRDFASLIYADDRLAFTAWARTLDIADESDVAEVARAMVDFVLPNGLPTGAEYDTATAVLIGEVPSYYFDNGLWNLDFEFAPEQVVLLLIYLLRRPEYQLC